MIKYKMVALAHGSRGQTMPCLNISLEDHGTLDNHLQSRRNDSYFFGFLF